MRTIRDEDAPAAGARYDANGVARETDKAILVELYHGDRVWVPKSVIHDDSEVYAQGHVGVLVVHSWWAAENMGSVGDLGGKSPSRRGTGKAIGVSDLAAVQKLLECKGIERIEFRNGTLGPYAVVETKACGGFTGADLTEAVRKVDAARKG